MLLPPPLPMASATSQCRCLVILCCIAAADTSFIALPPLLLHLSRAGWLLHCQHVGNQGLDMTYDVKKNIKSCNVSNMAAVSADTLGQHEDMSSKLSF
jgi:hypothetical protein